MFFFLYASKIGIKTKDFSEMLEKRVDHSFYQVPLLILLLKINLECHFCLWLVKIRAIFSPISVPHPKKLFARSFVAIFYNCFLRVTFLQLTSKLNHAYPCTFDK